MGLESEIKLLVYKIMKIKVAFLSIVCIAGCAYHVPHNKEHTTSLPKPHLTAPVYSVKSMSDLYKAQQSNTNLDVKAPQKEERFEIKEDDQIKIKLDIQ